MLSRQPRKNRIQFRQAVGGAARLFLISDHKGSQTRLVVLVIFHENGD
jgi:hypothetical protein